MKTPYLLLPLLATLALASCNEKLTSSRYTVTFEANGGTAFKPIAVERGKTLALLPDPRRDDFTFSGWYTDTTTATAFTLNTPVTANTTLYARWTPITLLRYSVAFENPGGVFLPSSKVERGQTVAQPPDPTRKNYTFGGWYTDQATTNPFVFSTPITANTTLHAQWTPVPRYAITFDSRSGTAVATDSVFSGQPVARPVDPTLTGSTFGGWYTDQATTTPFVFSTPITADITLYAKWTARHKVTFNTQGGSAVPVDTVLNGQTAPRPTDDPTLTGSTFGGWYTDQATTTPFVFSTPITADITLYAKWTALHKVTFDTNGGTTINPISVNQGQPVARPVDPTLTGSTFGGWYTDQATTTAFDFQTAITADITLYAKWTALHKVTFDTNGGTTINPISVNQGQPVARPVDPTLTGSTFGGWYTDQATTTPFVFSTPITADITLYAKWTALHKVTFDTNGGTTINPISVNQGQPVARPVDPTLTGSTFGGWYTDQATTTAFDFQTAITTNITLYARWMTP